MVQLLLLIEQVFPCRTCANDLKDYIAHHPPKVFVCLFASDKTKVSGRSELELWMCQTHNHVNERLGKPIFPCRRVRERWSPETPDAQSS